MTTTSTTCKNLKSGDHVTFFGDTPSDDNPIYRVTADWDPLEPAFIYTDDPTGDSSKGIAHDMWDGDAPVTVHS